MLTTISYDVSDHCLLVADIILMTWSNFLELTPGDAGVEFPVPILDSVIPWVLGSHWTTQGVTSLAFQDRHWYFVNANVCWSWLHNISVKYYTIWAFSNAEQGDSGILETTQGRFFLLSSLLLNINKVCFRPKMVCYFHIPVEKFSAASGVSQCTPSPKNR